MGAKIIADPDIAMGKPVISGTRLPVEFILEKLAAGESFEDLLAAHPRLTREGIQAALAFAARALRADVVYPVERASLAPIPPGAGSAGARPARASTRRGTTS